MSRPAEFLAWAVRTFGPIALDRQDRAARFLEEAIELAQSEDVSVDVVKVIVDRVYQRPGGYLHKEIGQAMVTLECLAENLGISADAEAAREFDRVRSIPPEEHQRRFAAKIAMGIAAVGK